ncbi:MAG TPA: phosphopyruvate hydratase [Methanoregulaceae archaeon]|nr:phosphopyruvate hydratase [Methanolinea sp.]MDD3091563.1 phosphopyruvate hydratase [Methanoregulaceae archaeon]MDD5047332.1 phosphopyruvate hydratase [Methanoregulaceae archaeon]MDD5684172.1 phosphopyruvate hydratase [Methanoregulaceae archaeon]HPJ74444.1 phosphopyruvate hydratase [Methanoregulaceae archaeon]
MTVIREIQLRSILDSRGNPTVEADIFTEWGFGRAAAPSGASTGLFEAKVKDPFAAVEHARQNVIPSLIGEDSRNQVAFDGILREIDGTGDFATIGANIAVALSLANAKAAASSLDMDLFSYLGGPFVSGMPMPLGNVIGGGAHAEQATEIQEFLVVPTGAAGMAEAVFANAHVHRTVKELLKARGKSCGKGDEGAWAPKIDDIEAFEIITEAVSTVSDELDIPIRIGIDVAASQMWDEAKDAYRFRSGTRTTEEMVGYIAELVDRYNLVYVEDPLYEEDFSGFSDLTEQVGDRCLVCGDDLFVTNVSRIIQGIEQVSANCVLIKPNQVGTLTDTFEAVHMAHAHGMDTVMSHRSGETTDETIAHLATAFSCIFLKTGIVGGERIAKLNELIRIEEQIE